MLGGMDISSTQIDTKGFQSLLSLVGNTANDSFDLYYGLFMYNPNATEELERMERSFDEVKRTLFKRLHDIAREQIMAQPAEEAGAPGRSARDLVLASADGESDAESSSGEEDAGGAEALGREGGAAAGRQ